MRSNRKPVAKTSSTLLVSQGRVRADDDPLSIIIDYAAEKLVLLLPARRIYWRGSASEYVDLVSASERSRRFRTAAKDKDKNKSATPPKVEVKATDETAELAGWTAKKYVVLADGVPFQQIWVAPDVKLGDDLEPRRLHEFQQKIGEGVRSRNRRVYDVLYKDPAYLALYTNGFPVRTESYLGKAVIGRQVLRISPATIDDREFAVPEGYTLTALVDLLDARDALWHQREKKEEKKDDPRG